MQTDPITFLGTEIPPLDRAGLKKFGLMFAAIIAALFGLILPLSLGFSIPWWPWLIAALFLVASMAKPEALAGFYGIWMRFGVIMNIIMSRIILGAVFLLTVTPTALYFKLRGKDLLGLMQDTEVQSYRVQSDASEPTDMKKPY